MGQASPDNLHVVAILTLPAVMAVLSGVRLVKPLPESLFFKIVFRALLGISLRLIWQGAVKL